MKTFKIFAGPWDDHEFLLDYKRKVIHVDMDAFFASVEELDHPKWRNKPLVVGGNPKSRGVVCAANYIARKYKVHSAMPCSQAYRLCPKAIFTPPRFARYKEISKKVHSIFASYTDKIQPLSLDEAWLDLTENKKDIPYSTKIASLIQKEIQKEIGLTCSVGVSFNKTLAKIASDLNKPNGITVITPEMAPRFLWELKIKKIPGIGPVSERKLKKLDIVYGKDLLNFSLNDLIFHFGSLGKSLYYKIRGKDLSEVKRSSKTKSISTENTFSKDFSFSQELCTELEYLIVDLLNRAKLKNSFSSHLILKVRFDDFQIKTKSFHLSFIPQTLKDLYPFSEEILKEICSKYPEKKIRLLGLGFQFKIEKRLVEGSLIDYFKSK